MSLFRVKAHADSSILSDGESASPADTPFHLQSRRSFLAGCGCSALYLSPVGAALLASESRAEARAGGERLRIGHLPAGCVSHVLLAKKRGLFAKAGLNVELTQFNGPSENLQALLSESLDAMHNPWTTTMAAYGEGSRELRIIGGSGQAGIELVARKGSVKNVAEFIDAAGKGLRVGTLRLDTLELVGYGTMAKHGKSYDDYKMTFFPSMVGMGEGIANGSIDVCTLAQPYAQSVVAKNGATYLTDSNSVWGPHAPDCVINTTTKSLSAKQAVLKTYMAILKDAAASMAADYDAAVAELEPIYSAPKAILYEALRRQSPNPVIQASGVNGIRSGMKYLIALGYFKDNFADAVMDLRLQPAA
ncbi:ABC transporter substrate-binding protein [Pandoraea anhela]|uniref:Sulfonate-binding protein n=1 Tax=Pandoraea anhela TaxID=2508295 RepID=A0A5E4YS44_9BURK|nr:ABC transporter substrate-binding protein [Pandoraea anhela]VVE51322.1 sulfonate-binding protein [Pandoraea anhela]